MILDADIIDHINTEFAGTDAPLAQAELAASGKDGRIARCIVLASAGSLQRLRELLQLADVDYRDVIVAGEYDSAMRHVRDLRVSFLIASPDDFWISETATTIHKYGYCLVQLNSHPATRGPFEYTCDRTEGIATFSDERSVIKIEKRDRKWLLVHDGSNLRPYGLDAWFDNEERFQIQLDYYLSRQ
jgi:hypothetical protein